MDREAATAGNKSARRPVRVVVLFHVAALVGAVTVAWATAGLDRWRLGEFLLLGAFVILSTLTDVNAGVIKVRVAGDMIGIMMTIALLGPGPAVVLGGVTIFVSWLRTRVAAHFTLINLSSFVLYPLLSGLFFYGVVRLFDLGSDDAAYYLVVFPTFVVALAVNFTAVFASLCYLNRGSLVHAVRDVLAPLLSAQLFSALLAMGATYVVIETGTVGILLTVLALLIFQYLIGELLKSKQRGEKLHRIATTDELTGLAEPRAVPRATRRADRFGHDHGRDVWR